MPRLIARLIPALLMIAAGYSVWLLAKQVWSGALTKRERTRLIFAAIIAVAMLILLFGVSFTDSI